MVLLWRAGLRISEALTLNESDLDPIRGSVLVRHGKRDRRREIGMDPWGWEQLRPWLEYESISQSAHCCASSTERREVVHGPLPLLVIACGVLASKRAYGDGLLLINFDTPTPSSSHAKVSR